MEFNPISNEYEYPLLVKEKYVKEATNIIKEQSGIEIIILGIYLCYTNKIAKILSLPPGRLSNLVHGESYTFIHKRLIIVGVYLHQDGVSNILIVVNLKI